MQIYYTTNLVSSGCYNKNVRLGNWKDTNLHLAVLEAESPRSGCGHGQDLVRTLFLFLPDGGETE